MTSIAGGFAAPAGRTGHELLVLRSLEQVSKNFEGSKTVACLKHTPPQDEFESSSALIFLMAVQKSADPKIDLECSKVKIGNTGNFEFRIANFEIPLQVG